MPFFFSRKSAVIAIIILVVGAGVFLIMRIYNRPVLEPIKELPVPVLQQKIIGRSVEGRDIWAHSFGRGSNQIIFVGGIHGGYEWNSVLLAYQVIDKLTAEPDMIPGGLTVTVIPVLNPDGLFKVTSQAGRFNLLDIKKDLPNGIGRFNANGVDLNRNFACNWQATSTWKNNIVSAGSAVFSEPEALALRKIVLEIKPKAVVFWHSKSNAVYASECNNGILSGTLDIMNLYAKASGYPAVNTFDSYKITGDAEGWLASQNIPAITVELQTHESIEWEKNLAGIKALFNYFYSNNQVK